MRCLHLPTQGGRDKHGRSELSTKAILGTDYELSANAPLVLALEARDGLWIGVRNRARGTLEPSQGHIRARGTLETAAPILEKNLACCIVSYSCANYSKPMADAVGQWRPAETAEEYSGFCLVV